MSKSPSIVPATEPSTQLAAAKTSRSKKTHTGRKPPPPNETAREKFLRLGQARMQNAIHAIRLLGNLARTNDYDYSERDVAVMHAALTEAVDTSLSKFKPSEKVAVSFSFINGTGDKT